jgi:hypothetical protein
MLLIKIRLNFKLILLIALIKIRPENTWNANYCVCSSGMIVCVQLWYERM